MELTDNLNKELTFDEVDTDEFYGDGWFIGGAIAGAIWAGVTLT